MKNTLTLMMIFALLFGLTVGCKNGALSKLNEPKSKCAVNLPALNSGEKYVERGMNEINEGDYECAFDDCQKAFDIDSSNADALICRGGAYRKRGDFDAAQNDFDEAIQLSPNNPMFLYQRSQLFRDQKLYDKALADINATFTDSPTAYDYAARAEIYAYKNDFTNATKDFTEAIRLKPERQEFYKQRAASYHQAGKTDLADADERKYEELQAAGNAADEAVKESHKTAAEKITETILNDEAVSLPKPIYPPAAKAVRASGEVRVEIAVDAKGNVQMAKAVSGNPFLRAAAEQAARQAKFKPLPMNGILIFNFSAPN
jgi:TonB family protein